MDSETSPPPNTTAADTSTTTTTTTTTTTDPSEPPTTGAPEPPDETTGELPGETTGGTTGEPVGPWQPKDCPKIFAQDLLPTFEIELDPSELEGLHEEWLEGDDHNTPEHPIKLFKYEDTVITDASVRLRGNSTWWKGQNKMQFEISFNTYTKGKKFMGLKRLVFDAAEFNESFLRDRLAMAVLRDVGIPAPCANNARLVLNGEYYGLFTSIEKVDDEFLERRFEDATGNLYKRGGSWEKKENKDDPDESDIEALMAAETVDDLLAIMNLDEAVLEWATEAVMPDNDGAWAGGLNLYMYNDPKTGFNIIPWDKDSTFTRIEFDVDPYTYIKPNDKGRPQYDIALADPVWFQKYIAAIEYVLKTGYDVAVLQQRIDTWSAQIATAAAEDPNKPFTTALHIDAVKDKREFVAKRAAFVKEWLVCWQNGGKKGKNGKCVAP